MAGHGTALMWGCQTSGRARRRSYRGEALVPSWCCSSFLSHVWQVILMQGTGCGWPQCPMTDVGTTWRQESKEKAYPELYWKNQGWYWRRNVKVQDNCCQGSVFSLIVQQIDVMGCEDPGQKFTCDQLVYTMFLTVRPN